MLVFADALWDTILTFYLPIDIRMINKYLWNPDNKMSFVRIMLKVVSRQVIGAQI